MEHPILCRVGPALQLTHDAHTTNHHSRTYCIGRFCLSYMLQAYVLLLIAIRLVL
jgi:hypothetical protein